MTRLLARILLAILMIPLAALVYLAVFLLLDSNDVATFFALVWAAVATAYFVVCYWLLLWRRSICWTRGRIWATVLAGPACVLVGTIVGVLVGSLMWRVGDLGALLGGFLSIILWLAATVFLWQETPAERAERVQRAIGCLLLCPRCGYNMTGLYESRCPECGHRCTLDELYAAQGRVRAGDAQAAGATGM
jgi:hypothetical protein